MEYRTFGTFGGTDSVAYAFSADGAVVVGSANIPQPNNTPHAFKWTAAQGMVDLGTLGGHSSSASACSSDGSVIVGYANVADNSRRAFRWTQAGGMVDLIGAGGTYTEATACSSAGHVVVGAMPNRYGTSHAFRWVQGSGFVDLDMWPETDTLSHASACSSDGSVVVGYFTYPYGHPQSGGGTRAFRWAGAMEVLPVPADFLADMQATFCSSDGGLVTGTYTATGNVAKKFRWTASEGTTTLTILPGYTYLTHSDDGVAAFYSKGANDQINLHRETETAGMEDIGRFGEAINYSFYVSQAGPGGVLVCGQNYTTAGYRGFFAQLDVAVRPIFWDRRTNCEEQG